MEIVGGVELFVAAFRDCKVIVTGHTGFKGALLAYWLVRLGAKVAGVFLEDGRDGLLDSLGVRESLHVSYVGDLRGADRLMRDGIGGRK